MARIFVLGDVHGAYRALRQCFDRSGFDRTHDRLIFLGDICDGWPETRECIEELLTIKNLTFILGNHDWWMLRWINAGMVENIWYDQGGKATIESYNDAPIPGTHHRLIESALPYLEWNGKLFVHAGISRDIELRFQTMDTFLWDRSLAHVALQYYATNLSVKLTSFDEVYIGHTPVASDKPIKACEVWLMDTGAGWSGVLSMMDIESKEIFTSDAVPLLYPGVKGRTRKH